jgi:hypothetical protein
MSRGHTLPLLGTLRDAQAFGSELAVDDRVLKK